MARVLGTTRLSHDTDSSTSIERQRESIEAWAKAHGHTVVAITEDTDMSGGIAPQDRDDLGPWLTDRAKLAQWDILCVAKLDRLTRSVRDFDDLRIWADEHGKTIASVAGSLDLSTSTGRMFANLLAMFAQFERERMSERRAEASRKLYSRGGYNGGLHAKRRVLIDAGVRTEARREVRDTAEPLTDRWMSLSSDHERGALLRSMRYRIMARKTGPGKVRIRLQQVRDGDFRHWTEMVDEMDELTDQTEQADLRNLAWNA